jgi:hypothetical protein
MPTGKDASDKYHKILPVEKYLVPVRIPPMGLISFTKSLIFLTHPGYPSGREEVKLRGS